MVALGKLFTSALRKRAQVIKGLASFSATKLYCSHEQQIIQHFGGLPTLDTVCLHLLDISNTRVSVLLP